MKVIIAGSRDITNYDIVLQAVKKSLFKITEVVSGGAQGVDKLGEKLSKQRSLSLRIFEADWEDISSPEASVRVRKDGSKYNVLAGFWRNEEMAEYADGLIAVWKDKSRGTGHMIKTMAELGKPVFVYEV